MSSVGKKVLEQENQGSVKKKASSRTAGDSDEEDSDVDMERNFALLSKRAAGGAVDEEESDIDMERNFALLSKRAAGGAVEEEESDIDMERNFALLSKKAAGGALEEEEVESGREGEEGEDSSDSEYVDEEEAGSDGDDEDDGLDDGDDNDEGEDEEEGSESSGTDGDSEGSQDADDDVQSEGTDHNSKLQTEDDVKKELSTMSFEDIMKLQNKVGTKVFNEIAYGTTKATQANVKKKRLNKNRPMEVSSKRHAPFLRQVVPVKKTVSRDPRFDDLSGEYKPEIFEKTYKFINDIKQQEKKTVQNKLKKTKKTDLKEKLQFLLKRMENQESARKSREQQREKELEFKRKQREMAGQGLKPFFLKKSDKKKLQLADKYNALKKSGKLENFLSKKRKRNAGKDRRKLPRQQHSKAQ